MVSDNREEGGSPQLFTASDIARFCQVDLKTIHNWSDKGEIRHFRTPGRHLRFRRVDVLEFLRKYGYPVPPALREGKPRVMAVDEDAQALASLRRSLARRFEVKTFADPFEALVDIGMAQPDVLIVDPSMKSLDGLRMIERLRSIPSTTHSPVIAFSADDARRRQLEAAGALPIAKSSPATLRDALEKLTGVERAGA